LILWPASDNAQFMLPVIVDRFPMPGLGLVKAIVMYAHFMHPVLCTLQQAFYSAASFHLI